MSVSGRRRADRIMAHIDREKKMAQEIDTLRAERDALRREVRQLEEVELVRAGEEIVSLRRERDALARENERLTERLAQEVSLNNTRMLAGDRAARLEEALRGVVLRAESDGTPCWCVGRLNHSRHCLQARAALTPPTEGKG